VCSSDLNKEDWKKQNANGDIPTHNAKGHQLVIGCNYHTTWQTHKSMRFVLTEIKGSKARLQTRNSRKDFLTNVDDLIFINSEYNKHKAKELKNSNK
jgi:hypothetical protein